MHAHPAGDVSLADALVEQPGRSHTPPLELDPVERHAGRMPHAASLPDGVQSCH